MYVICPLHKLCMLYVLYINYVCYMSSTKLHYVVFIASMSVHDWHKLYKTSEINVQMISYIAHVRYSIWAFYRGLLIKVHMMITKYKLRIWGPLLRFLISPVVIVLVQLIFSPQIKFRIIKYNLYHYKQVFLFKFLFVRNTYLVISGFVKHFTLINFNISGIDPVFPCGHHEAIKAVKNKRENMIDTPTVLITNIPNWNENLICANNIKLAAPNVVMAPESTETAIFSSMLFIRPSRVKDGEVQ